MITYSNPDLPMGLAYMRYEIRFMIYGHEYFFEFKYYKNHYWAYKNVDKKIYYIYQMNSNHNVML